jgi:hypothetical protein
MLAMSDIKKSDMNINIYFTSFQIILILKDGQQGHFIKVLTCLQYITYMNNIDCALKSFAVCGNDRACLC